MRFFLPAMLLLFLCNRISGQSCPPNIDFEQGDFTGWQCFVGQTYTLAGSNVINLKPSPPTPNRHEIISADSNGVIPIDAFGKFPKLCPYGGKFSVKLGNTDVGAEAEGISYTFTVPSNEDSFSFTYFYAVVFENPQHAKEEQPRFFVTAFETSTGNLINCASYNYVSTGGIPGFKKSASGGDVLYKEWSPVTIQFVGLANKQVTLEFKTADCTQGGHFGYAYLDVGSGCSNILATAPYCVETNSLLLNAPYGFQSYTWYNEDYTQVLGYDQNLTLSPPPVQTGKFWVDLQPYAGYGCRDTAYAVVTPLPVPDTPIAKSDYFFCQNAKAPPFQATPSINCLLLWYTDTTKPGVTDAIMPPTNTPGVFYYYVSQKVLFGCESFRKKIRVQVDPVPVTSFNLDRIFACQAGNSFTCVSTSTNLLSPTYTWDFGNGATLSGPDSTTYTYPSYGSFNITLQVRNGPVCSFNATHPVTVGPKPIADFVFPPLICQNETPVSLKDQSTVPQQLSTIAQWYWQVQGNVTTQQNPAGFIATAGGDIPVLLAVASKEGCISDTARKNLKVRYQPTASFTYDDPLCNNKMIHFTDLSFLPAGAVGENVNTWKWKMDNVPVNVQNPAYHYNSGIHTTSLIATTNYGCNSTSISSSLTVHEKPLTALSINDSCAYRKIIYTAQDVSKTVQKWYWDFGIGFNEDKSEIVKYFLNEGQNSFTLIGKTVDGCTDTIHRPFTIYMNKAFAGKDTMAAFDQPVQLNAHGGSDNHYRWSPAIGLNDPHIENPVAIYDKDVLYRLDAMTNEGCDAHSAILVKRYNGPDIYIPTGFTPNSDRLNDVLRAFPVGMKSFEYFAVYARNGERIYYTTDFHNGWDGTIRYNPAQSGTYVAVARAVDYTGKVFFKKVAVVLIR